MDFISRPPLQNSQFDNRESPSSNQFVWPSNYVATSTPVTSASTPVPHSPARSYHQQHHHMVGLPVASTQYRSPYAVPQSSSGSSASTGFREAPPPPPPPLHPPQPPVTTNSYMTHTLPVIHSIFASLTEPKF